MIQRGELHAVKTGRVWGVTVESLERFLQPGLPAVGSGAATQETAEERAARVTAIRGKYRDLLPSVDDYIAQKQEEIALENRRWPTSTSLEDEEERPR
jgi:hypothetical protein